MRQISEIIEDASKIRSKKERLAFFQNEIVNKKNAVLRHVLEMIMNPDVQFLLPPGPTPIKKEKFESEWPAAALYGEFRKMYLFIKGGHPTLKQHKREQLWVEFVSGLPEGDRKLMDMIKDRNVQYSYITPKFIEELLKSLPERK